MEPRIQYAKTSDGVSIAYWTLGEGKPLVIMAPQIWSHLQLEWRNPAIRRWYEQLAETRRLVRYDFRGEGLSERNVGGLTLEAFLLDLETVVDHLELEQFALYAIGPNTPIVIAYVARHPERVSHLILWQPVAKLVSSNPLLDLAEKDWELFTESAAHAMLGWSAGQIAHEWAGFIRQSIDQKTWVEMAKEFDRMDATPQLPEVSTPTLVLTHMQGRGQLDPGQVSAFASRMQNARVVFLEGPDSAIPFSDTARRAINEFLDEGEKAPAAAELPEGMAVILFTDIANSTALTEQLGDAAFRTKATGLDGLLRSLVRQADGTPVEGKVMGDGVMAVFTSARRAIDCAVRCKKAGDDGSLPLHLGIHAGDVIREGNNVYGGAVNLTARIADASAPGEILVSDTLRGLARTSSGVAFDDRGEHTLKGIAEPQRLFAVRGEGAA